MAKMITKGVGRREVACDRVEITIELRSRRTQSRDALKEVMEQCERFLGELKGLGYDIGAVEAGRNDVRKEEFTDNPYAIASRAITFKADYDLNFIDLIMRIAKADTYSVNLTVNPYLSNRDQLHEELRAEAVRDARRQAELTAAGAGLSIAGVERITLDEAYEYAMGEAEESAARMKAVCSDSAYGAFGGPGLYSELGKELLKEEETVYIEWLLE